MTPFAALEKQANNWQYHQAQGSGLNNPFVQHRAPVPVNSATSKPAPASFTGNEWGELGLDLVAGSNPFSGVPYYGSKAWQNIENGNYWSAANNALWGLASFLPGAGSIAKGVVKGGPKVAGKLFGKKTLAQGGLGITDGYAAQMDQGHQQQAKKDFLSTLSTTALPFLGGWAAPLISSAVNASGPPAQPQSRTTTLGKVYRGGPNMSWAERVARMHLSGGPINSNKPAQIQTMDRPAIQSSAPRPLQFPKSPLYSNPYLPSIQTRAAAPSPSWAPGSLGSAPYS